MYLYPPPPHFCCPPGPRSLFPSAGAGIFTVQLEFLPTSCGLPDCLIHSVHTYSPVTHTPLSLFHHPSLLVSLPSGHSLLISSCCVYFCRFFCLIQVHTCHPHTLSSLLFQLECQQLKNMYSSTLSSLTLYQ